MFKCISFKSVYSASDYEINKILISETGREKNGIVFLNLDHVRCETIFYGILEILEHPKNIVQIENPEKVIFLCILFIFHIFSFTSFATFLVQKKINIESGLSA